MKAIVRVANPAGNITVLVKTPIKKESYANVAEKLLSLIDGAEQVGFLAKPLFGGAIRLEMMGGEFCGNALRSTALCYAVENGCVGEKRVMTEISGIQSPLPVSVDAGNSSAIAAMPFPQNIAAIPCGCGEAIAVFFEGIVHVITDQPVAGRSRAEIKRYLQGVSARYRVAAAGLMFYTEETATLTPVVYVVATDTMFYENSCASGSAAVAAALAQKGSDGSMLIRFREPGGVMEAVTEKRNGQLQSLQIGGKIFLSDEKEVEI